MYFSITYGPDMAGAVSMNFGPLNRDGGERRLNVAVTRARHELRVFSSLRGEQIDLSRTKANGVCDLKHFLEFAEYGPRALAEAHHGSQGDFESPFESSVATALGRKGWQVHPQIGASSFCVDLGVVHPDSPGRYLAGVECDGATYHSSATARDRDKLREQVLRGLGWEIVRIWSTDWWVNPGGTLERVHAALTELLEKDREQRAKEAEAQPAEAVPEPDDAAAAPSLDAIDEADAAITRTAVGPQTSADGDHSDTEKQAEAGYAHAASPLPVSVHIEKADTRTDCRFLVSQPSEAVSACAISTDQFYESGYDAVLQPMVEWVVRHEGPVLDAVLARRIARTHGFQRTGRRIQERVEKIAQRLFKTTEEASGTFYWPRELELCGEIAFRWPADDDSTRGVEEICEAELLSLARLVLHRGHAEQDALIAMARELGLQRLREASRGRLESALLMGRESKYTA
jgi:hypothetical protein